LFLLGGGSIVGWCLLWLVLVFFWGVLSVVGWGVGGGGGGGVCLSSWRSKARG